MKQRIKKSDLDRFIRCGYIVIKAGYFPNITEKLEPFGYTCGRYGWNSDLCYIGDHVILNTGYRPQAGRQLTEAEYKLLSQYDSKVCNFRQRKRIANNFVKRFLKLQEV